jgi:predicted nuclease of predicted toxin-antitoxin system
VRFLLDVCASSRSLTQFLKDLGHDSLSVVAIDAKADDAQVLQIALNEDRVLVTEDKDFGELIFVRGLPHGTIIRFCEMTVDEQVNAMQELLDSHLAALQSNAIVTVRRGRIRIRS